MPFLAKFKYFRVFETKSNIFKYFSTFSNILCLFWYLKKLHQLHQNPVQYAWFLNLDFRSQKKSAATQVLLLSSRDGSGSLFFQRSLPSSFVPWSVWTWRGPFPSSKMSSPTSARASRRKILPKLSFATISILAKNKYLLPSA